MSLFVIALADPRTALAKRVDVIAPIVELRFDALRKPEELPRRRQEPYAPLRERQFAMSSLYISQLSKTAGSCQLARELDRFESARLS